MSSVGDTSLWRMFHSWTKLAVGGLGRLRAIMRNSGRAVGRRVRKLARPQSLWLEVCATHEPRLGGAGRFFRGGDSLAQGGVIVWQGAGFPSGTKSRRHLLALWPRNRVGSPSPTAFVARTRVSCLPARSSAWPFLGGEARGPTHMALQRLCPLPPLTPPPSGSCCGVGSAQGSDAACDAGTCLAVQQCVAALQGPQR